MAHQPAWGLADLEAIKRKRIVYYVTKMSTLVAKATYLRSDPLSDNELAVHRPDLPFAPVRDSAISWSSDHVGALVGDSSELHASPI
ncbi:MAG TPA: hypothetical protein VME67_23160 [Mycobacterium sp.]|nr:hypothetical protein [Mycobacterium sp.]HTX97476.1 hypothetical protein [Mycobacterium sp.]